MCTDAAHVSCRFLILGVVKQTWENWVFIIGLWSLWYCVASIKEAQYVLLFLCIQPLIVLSSPKMVLCFLWKHFLVIEAIIRQILNDKLEQYGLPFSLLHCLVSLPLLAASVFYCGTSRSKLAVEKHLLSYRAPWSASSFVILQEMFSSCW